MADEILGNKIEDACVLVAEDLDWTDSPELRTSRSDDLKEATQFVEFSFEKGEEEPMNTDNFFGVLTAKVMTIAKDGMTAHKALCSEVGDMMNAANLATLLTEKSSEVDGLHVYDAMEKGFESGTSGDYLMEVYTRRIYACE